MGHVDEDELEADGNLERKKKQQKMMLRVYLRDERKGDQNWV